MRIRYLKPDFFKDEDLADRDFCVRILYAGLWSMADKEGRLEDRPRRIKADIFPYDDVDIVKGLDSLCKTKSGSGRPFIQRYKINDSEYIQILSWYKHQKPHHTEKDSEIPSPPSLNDNEIIINKRKDSLELKDNVKVKVKGNGDGKPARSELEVKQRLNNGYLTVKNKTPQGCFMDSFKELYVSKTGHPYNDTQVEYIAIARMLKKHGTEILVEKVKILAEHCDKKDIWFTKDGWTDFTIPKLESMFNRLLLLQMPAKTDWAAMFQDKDKESTC